MTLASDPKPFSFLRLPSAAHRRRARPWVAFARRAGKVLAFVLPLAATAYWLLVSPRFGVSEIGVEGAQRVDAEWLDSRFAGTRGANLLLLDLDELRQDLESHPWVRSVSISKRLPSRLEVAFAEHQPVAVLRAGDRMAVISHYGEIIETDGVDLEGGALEIVVSTELEPGAPSESTVVSAALGVGQSVRAASPSWCRSLQQVEVISPGHLQLRFGELPFSLLVRTETALERVLLFDRLRGQVVERYAPLRHVDLRMTRRIVLQPATDVGKGVG